MGLKGLLVSSLIVFSSAVMAHDENILGCGGTGPYWTMGVSSDEISYEEPMSDVVVKYEAVKPRTAENRGEELVRVYETKSLKDGAKATIVISQRDCSNGMSPIIDDYEILLITGDKVLNGCCSLPGGGRRTDEVAN